MSMVYLDALSLDCCTDPDSLTIISSFPLSSLLGNRHQRSVVDCNCAQGGYQKVNKRPL